MQSIQYSLKQQSIQYSLKQQSIQYSLKQQSIQYALKQHYSKYESSRKKEVFNTICRNWQQIDRFTHWYGMIENFFYLQDVPYYFAI